MSRESPYQIPLSSAFLAIGLCALFFARGLSFWFVLLVTILIAIHVCVEVLTQGIPTKLRDLSSANCFRMDGTRSHRRADREQRAIGKIRSDLWAVFLVVAFAAIAGLFVLQTVFPLSLVDDVVAAAAEEPGNVKLALKKHGVDHQFFQWARTSSRSSNAEIRQQQNWLWVAWPIIVALVLAFCLGCLALVRFAYFRALREFEVGVKSRSTNYLNLDIGRLQG